VIANRRTSIDALMDLKKYSPDPQDKGIISWIVQRSEPERTENKADIMFRIKAQIVEKVVEETGSTASKETVAETKTEASKAEYTETNSVKDEL
jgi:hypothetical protein